MDAATLALIVAAVSATFAGITSVIALLVALRKAPAEVRVLRSSANKINAEASEAWLDALMKALDTIKELSAAGLVKDATIAAQLHNLDHMPDEIRALRSLLEVRGGTVPVDSESSAAMAALDTAKAAKTTEVPSTDNQEPNHEA